jgi:dUTP pyrophosphatase
MSEKKMGTVSPVLPKTVAQIVEQRTASRIPTRIVADDPLFIPEYKTAGAACCDLRANLPGGGFLNIYPGSTVKIDCGFSIEIPPGYEAQIRSRSGWASKGVMMSNGIGTIDEDYRGRITVILTNTSAECYIINHGDRIGQMAIKPVYHFEFESSDSLSVTERDTGGFGSTGVS